MKKRVNGILAVLLTFVMLLGAVPAALVDEAVDEEALELGEAAADEDAAVADAGDAEMALPGADGSGSDPEAAAKSAEALSNGSVAIEQGETATIKLSESKTLQLTTTLTSPNGSPNPKVTWSTSNRKVATVSKEGLVTAKKPGTVKITVTTSNKLKKTITVRIEK